MVFEVSGHIRRSVSSIVPSSRLFSGNWMMGKNESQFNDTASNLPGGKWAGSDAGHSEAEVMNAYSRAHIRLRIYLNEMHMESFSSLFNR
jgi:hypothetical protein